MNKKIQITFDKSSFLFVAEALGFNVKNDTLYKDKKIKKCCYCKKKININSIGGFLAQNQVFCSKITCLIEFKHQI